MVAMQLLYCALYRVCECTGQRAAKDTEMVTYPGY